MSQSDPYRIFVSHGWEDHEEFDRLFEFLESNPTFFYDNSGRPETKPETADHEELKKAMGMQIASAEVVVILAGLYTQHRDWLSFQLELAKRMNKPIIGIHAFGDDTIPPQIEELAADIVKWETGAIIEAIKHHARGESTGRFETVEFVPPDMDD